MPKKSEEIHALLKVIGEYKLDKPSLMKNLPRYKEVKLAILELADIIWDCDENAKINVVEEMGTAITVHVESSLFATGDLLRMCTALNKATRVEIFPAAGGIGACVIFDGVFIKQND